MKLHGSETIRSLCRRNKGWHNSHRKDCLVFIGYQYKDVDSHTGDVGHLLRNVRIPRVATRPDFLWLPPPAANAAAAGIRPRVRILTDTEAKPQQSAVFYGGIIRGDGV